MKSTINMDNMDSVFDEMVNAQAKQLKDEQDTLNCDTKQNAINVLTKFKSYITGAKFNLKCRWEAKKVGASYEVVKNSMLRTVLGKIADTLGLVIEITGEVIKYTAKFISTLIGSLANLAVHIAKKIISIFTLNCGQTCNAN